MTQKASIVLMFLYENLNLRPGSQYDVRLRKACVCAYKNKIYGTYKSMVVKF